MPDDEEGDDPRTRYDRARERLMRAALDYGRIWPHLAIKDEELYTRTMKELREAALGVYALTQPDARAPVGTCSWCSNPIFPLEPVVLDETNETVDHEHCNQKREAAQVKEAVPR